MGLNGLGRSVPIDAVSFSRLWPPTSSSRIRKVRYALPCPPRVEKVELDIYEDKLYPL